MHHEPDPKAIVEVLVGVIAGVGHEVVLWKDD